MKNLLLLTLTLILFGFTGIAQVNLDNYSFNPEIKEASRLMSKGETNSYSIIIDGLSRKEVEKSWGKFMKNCCLLYTSPSPRDATLSRMPSSA